MEDKCVSVLVCNVVKQRLKVCQTDCPRRRFNWQTTWTGQSRKCLSAVPEEISLLKYALSGLTMSKEEAESSIRKMVERNP